MSSEQPLDVCSVFSVTSTWQCDSKSKLILHIHIGLCTWQHLKFLDML